MSEQSLAVRQALGVERLGEIMWKSGYWADTRSQAQAIVKILAGAELEFGPIASMNGIYIIEGKTTLSANLVGAAIQRSKRYRYRVVEHDATHCKIDFFENVGGKPEKLGTSEFSLEDAKAADLLTKGRNDRKSNWEKFPRNMVFSRALTNGARWYTPDVFGGPVYTPDELGAEVDMEGNVVEVEPYTPTREQDNPPPRAQPKYQQITSEDDRLWQRWLSVRSEALNYGVAPPSLSLPIGYDQLISNATMVKAQTEAKQARLAREEAAREEQEARPPEAAPEGEADAESPAVQGDLPPTVLATDPWSLNRELMTHAFAAGYKLRDLSADTPMEEVEVRNDEIRQLLDTART